MKKNAIRLQNYNPGQEGQKGLIYSMPSGKRVLKIDSINIPISFLKIVLLDTNFAIDDIKMQKKYEG